MHHGLSLIECISTGFHDLRSDFVPIPNDR